MISIEFTFKSFGMNIPPVKIKKLNVKIIPNKKLVKLTFIYSPFIIIKFTPKK